MREVHSLPRDHRQFDEAFLQELLAVSPDMLPVSRLRPDVGRLVCIGREVPTTDSGTMDNLYLSTGGYLVLVETKLWRNPEGRRTVISQVLDYVKDLARRDYEWIESVWQRFTRSRGGVATTLLEAMQEAADGDLDEAAFIDRVHLSIRRGDIIALVVGDGIESRLQELVAHLCRDSAHLRYSLGLVSLRCYQLPDSQNMLVVPELVQEVEPVERAYVRIDAAPGLQPQIVIQSAAPEPPKPSRTGSQKRTTLSEDQYYSGLREAVGEELAERVRILADRLVESGLEQAFQQSTMMLKVPDPMGEKPSASLLAIRPDGLVYNPDHGWNQATRWGWPEAIVDDVIGGYWKRLHQIDQRFALDGLTHARPSAFLPLRELQDRLDAIGEEMLRAAGKVADVANKGE